MKKISLSRGVLLAWDIAVIETTRAGQPHIGPEQLLCGLFKIKDVVQHIRDKSTIDPGDLEFFLNEVSTLDSILENLKLDRTRARRRLREIAGVGNYQWDKEATVHRSNESRKVFDRATVICQSFNAQVVNVIHLLEAIFENPTAAMETLLDELKVRAIDIKQNAERANGNPIPVSTDKNRDVDLSSDHAPVDHSDFFQNKTLSNLGRDLTAMAMAGQLDPLIGRRDELLQVVRTLTRKTKSNPVLVGEAGVGKTAIIEGLAIRIAEKNISRELWEHRIIELRMSTLIAGTKYRGEFEERLNQIIKLAEDDEALILFLDEMHTLVGAGGGGGSDAANILKPALARGKIHCIGATTFDEYQRYIESDAALARRFIRIRIEEPDESETLAILRGLLPSFENHHAVNIEDNALEAAVKLSVRYIKDRRLPDKAIDVLDEACAFVKVNTLSYTAANNVKQLQADGVFVAIEPVTSHIVAQVISEKTGIETADLIDAESDKYLRLEKELKQRIVGQDQAIEKVTARLQLAATGLRDEEKPPGVFLFLGPTGVGKTFLAETIAELLFGHFRNMIRIDMSEFMEHHTVARLVGSPPGYIGHDEEGQLTGALKKKPYTLVLLDEVEKAHPQVWDLFLQVFDDGRLTDGKGHTVDASHAIFVMTSNIGTVGKVNRQVGFINNTNDTENVHEHYLASVKENFKPEFINRIDDIVVFNPLSEDNIYAITVRELDVIREKLEERSVDLMINDDVIALLSQKCFSPEFGARHAQRTIETLVAKPLSEYLLQNKVSEGGHLILARDGDDVILRINKTE